MFSLPPAVIVESPWEVCDGIATLHTVGARAPPGVRRPGDGGLWHEHRCVAPYPSPVARDSYAELHAHPSCGNPDHHTHADQAPHAHAECDTPAAQTTPAALAALTAAL